MIPLIVGGAIAAGSIASNLYDSYKNREAARNAYNDIKDKSDAVVGQNESDIANYQRMVENTYGQGAANYNDALNKFLNSDVYQNQGFEFTGDINDYMDPFYNQRVDAAMTAINNSAASGGNRFSSDYVSRVGAKNQALASEAWQQSYDNLMRDRQQQLNEWQANSANGWNNYNATQDRAKYAVDQYGNDRNQLVQGISDATMAGMSNRLGGLQTQANVVAGKANSQQGQGILSQILGPAAQFAGSYFGAQN